MHRHRERRRTLRGAAEQLFPPALQMTVGGIGRSVKSRFIQIDGPHAAIRAHDEIPGVSDGQANGDFCEQPPQFAELTPKFIGKRSRLFRFVGKIRAQCLAFNVWIHQERIAAPSAPVVFNACNRARRSHAGIR